MKNPFKIFRYALLWISLASMATTPVLRAQTREETSLWESIKDSKDAEDYRAYLDKCPEGVYAPVAKRRVAQLAVHPSQQAPDSPLGMKKDLTAAQAPSTATPTAMTECEGTNNCATWTFLGGQGNGQWPSGEIANLTDDKTVTIRRADSTGASAGLTAVYSGTRHDDRVGGEFISSWPGHWANKSGNWYATVQKLTETTLPPEMHFCAQQCADLKLENGHYCIPGAYGNGSSTWTVESFTRESVILRRVDSTGFTARYTGKMSSAGNSVINALANGSYTFLLTWGAALNDIPDHGPGPHAPPVVRPVLVPVGPVICIPWFFGLVCG